MAKKPKQPPKQEPSDNDRFMDWELKNIIPIEPGEILVNDDPEGDPNMFPDYSKGSKK